MARALCSQTGVMVGTTETVKIVPVTSAIGPVAIHHGNSITQDQEVGICSTVIEEVDS
jgi:hypothetical protein